MKKGSVFIVLLICAANICNATDIEMKNIEGYYLNNEEYTDTVVELIITKDINEYKYKMTTPNRILEGKIIFSDDPECFYLDGIRWVSLEIDEEP